MAKAHSYDLKSYCRRRPLLNAAGEPMLKVPLIMMAATEIEKQGQLYKEMQNRGECARLL